jgi:hypothetical protein
VIGYSDFANPNLNCAPLANTELIRPCRCDGVWKALLFVEIFQFNHISNGALLAS